MIDAHDRKVTGICFSNDEKYVFSSSWDETLKQWSVQDQQLVKTFTGHDREVTCVTVSSDDRYLFSGSKDRLVLQWQITDG